MANTVRCTHCAAFMSAKPTFDGIIQHSIPTIDCDADGNYIVTGETLEEEYRTLWTCKKCGRDNDPDELMPPPDDGYEDTGGY